MQKPNLRPQGKPDSRKRKVEGDGVKRTPTYHEGANGERTAILAKIRRVQKSFNPPTLHELEEWLLQRNERYRKNPGGL